MTMTYNKEKLLSICLPSYNRGKYIATQVEFLSNFLTDNNLSDDVEILVANNRSSDATLQELQSLPYANFTIHTHELHYPTAEENIFRSVDLCSGKYVWFLGDDDPIQYNNLLYCIEQVRSEVHDCLLFNSSTTKNNGSIALSSPISIDGDHIKLSVRHLVESVGFLYTFAGISNLIVRRELLNVSEAIKWLDISPIYSHVAWFVDCLKGKSVTLFNCPLVRYRQAAYAADHWPRMAELLNVPSRYFWSVGLIKIFRELVSRKALTHSNIANIHEVAADGRRYRLLDEICFNVFQQLQCYGEALTTRESLSTDDLSLFRSFIISADPAYFDMANLLIQAHTDVASLESANDIREYVGKFSATFPSYFEDWVKENLFRGQFIGASNGFDLYSMPTKFVAVRRECADIHAALTTVNVTGDGLDIISSSTRDELFDQVRRSALERKNWESYREVVLTDQASKPIAGNSSLEAELDTARAGLRAVRESVSWRITAPMRTISGLFKLKNRAN